MAATKNARSLLASQSLAAGVSVDATNEWNLSAAYGGLACVRLTNGASAPTTAPVVKFFVGEATGVKRLFYTATGNTVNSSVSDVVCEIPLGAMFVNITITNGATNAITVEASGQELTAI
jgi:hypothetical protein